MMPSSFGDDHSCDIQYTGFADQEYRQLSRDYRKLHALGTKALLENTYVDVIIAETDTLYWRLDDLFGSDCLELCN